MRKGPRHGSARRQAKQMRQIRMLPNEAPVLRRSPGNLTLMETDFDLYQRHMTWVYVAGDDGKLVGLDLHLDNNFARLKSNNRTYKAEKYNPATRRSSPTAATRTTPSSARCASSPTRSPKAARSRSSPTSRPPTATWSSRPSPHWCPRNRPSCARPPRQAGRQRHAPHGRPRLRRRIRPPDPPHLEVTMPNLDYWLLGKRCAQKVRSRCRTATTTTGHGARKCWAAEGPVMLPRCTSPRRMQLDIKWWNLYWMPRRNLAYLVYSVRRFYDHNGIKKHVVIYQPLRSSTRRATRHRAQAPRHTGSSSTTATCTSSATHEQQLAQYDWDGNITGYSNYRRAPASFRGELSEKFTTPLTAGRRSRRWAGATSSPAYECGRNVGYTRKPQPWDYNSQIRNTFALDTGDRPRQKILPAGHGDNHHAGSTRKSTGFEHKTLKNATLEFTGEARRPTTRMSTS